LVAVAVKVTLVPEQIETPGLAAILALTGRFGFTVMVMLFEVTGFSTVHVSADVILQVTMSPLTRAAFVYVVLLEPTLAPLSFH